MSDSLTQFLQASVAADKSNPNGPQNNYNQGVVPIGSIPGVEQHQELGPEGKSFYQLPASAAEEASQSGITGLGGTKTRPQDYYGAGAPAAPQRAPTPEEMMRMADELEQSYVDQTDQSAIRGPYTHQALERDQTTGVYTPPTQGYNPPEWLAKYMENVPTTGTTMVDPLGHQRYSQDKERLKKLKAQRR